MTGPLLDTVRQLEEKPRISLKEYVALRLHGHSDDDLRNEVELPEAEVAAFHRAPAPERSGYINQVARGAFLGGSDEINAGAGALKDALPEALGGAPGVSIFKPKTLGEAFRGRHAAEDAGLKQFAGQNPLTSLAAQAAGGLLTNGALGAALKGAGIPMAAGRASALERTALGAGVGGVYGGLDAQPGERMAGAASGAEGGAAFGLLAPPLASKLGRKFGLVSKARQLEEAQRNMPGLLPETGPPAPPARLGLDPEAYAVAKAQIGQKAPTQRLKFGNATETVGNVEPSPPPPARPSLSLVDKLRQMQGDTPLRPQQGATRAQLQFREDQFGLPKVAPDPPQGIAPELAGNDPANLEMQLMATIERLKAGKGLRYP